MRHGMPVLSTFHADPDDRADVRGRCRARKAAGVCGCRAHIGRREQQAERGGKRERFPRGHGEVTALLTTAPAGSKSSIQAF